MPARVHSFRGVPAVTLTGGAYAASFLPDLGLLGASLRWRDQELLSRHGGLDAWRGGHTTGMPLLAPWANRLAGRSLRVGRVQVDLRRSRSVHVDGNGLPIHGLLLGEHVWRVERLEDDRDGGQLTASLDFDEHPRLFRAFPFSQRIEVTATVTGDGLSVETAVLAMGTRRVPVSFGWHPYFRIPGASRRDLVLSMPARQRLVMDDRQIPTGQTEPEPASTVGLVANSFDDGYRLGRDRRFTLSDGHTSLSVEFGRSYPFAQVFAPPGKAFVAIEPMTAPTNALETGTHPWVAAGERFVATFDVRAARS